MKKVIVIGLIVLLLGTITCVSDEGTFKKNSSVTSALGDFEVVTNFSNGIYTYTKIQNNQPQKINGDDYNYFWESNTSIYVVKVTSPSEFYLKNFYYTHNWDVLTDRPISIKRYRYCYLTNNIEVEMLKGIGTGGEFDLGHLDYFHIQLGNLKLTKDNRNLSNMNDKSITDIMTYKNPLLIPSGTWYFVFVGTIFDLDQDEMVSNISLWMNFSGTNLDISISGEGEVYGLWYGEFDANLIISRSHKFETMIGGKKQFSIEDTFIYQFTLIRPCNQGFWKMKWITPSGTKKMSIIMKDGIRYGDPDDYNECISGIGESGEYKLSTSYLDYWTGFSYASSIYFLGLDVKLF
jgi:hypothetical protein